MMVRSSAEHPLLGDSFVAMVDLQRDPQGLFAQDNVLAQVLPALVEFVEHRPIKWAFNLSHGLNGIFGMMGVEQGELHEVLPPHVAKSSVDGRASKEMVDVYWFGALWESLRLIGADSDRSGQLGSVQGVLGELARIAQEYPRLQPALTVRTVHETNKRNYPFALYAAGRGEDIRAMSQRNTAVDQKMKVLRTALSPERILPPEVSDALNGGYPTIPARFAWVQGAAAAYEAAHAMSIGS